MDIDADEKLREIVNRGLASHQPADLRLLAASLIQARQAPRCMLHPLAFYFVRLYEDGPVTIRLHYWPAIARPTSTAVTPYHDHVWSLQSCVLAGSIENVLLSLAPDPGGPYAVADIQQTGGIDAVVPLGERLSIVSQESAAYRTNDFYTISPRVFHCTNVYPGVAAVTIVRAEVTVQGGPRTLVPAGYSGQAPTRQYLDEPAAEPLFRDISELLEPV